MDLTKSPFIPGIIRTNLEELIKWSRKSSMWYLSFGIACCSVEALMAAGASRNDLERFGMFFRPSPRQADLMLVTGNVNRKMAPVVRTLYEQMADPKWVIAVGACAISGGAFRDSYNIINGVDKVIPVDVYVPGCPPRPEAVMDAILKLHEKIQRGEVPPERLKGLRTTEQAV